MMFDSISSSISTLASSDAAQQFLFLAQENAAPQSDRIISLIPNGVLAFLTLIAIVVVSIFIGRTISRSIRLPEYGSKIALILWCILTASLLIAANGFVPKFGIDLRGGINMIGSLNLDAIGAVDDPFGSRQTTAADIIPNLIRRVDPSGTQEIQIRPLGNDKIEVTIPTDSEVEALEIWARLVKTGKLQFLIVNQAGFSKHNEARQIALDMADKGNLSRRVGSVTKVINDVEVDMPMAKWFSLAKEDEEVQGYKPFKMLPGPSMLLRDSASGRLVDAAKIPISTNDDDFSRLEFTKWWQENFRGSPQILLMEPDDESMRVTGEDLDASQLAIGFDERGRDSINFGLTADGSDRMFNFTWEHKPSSEGKYLMAIVLDDQTHTAPQLNDTITRSGRITGNFSRKEVDDLIISLRSGNIDVALNDNPISKTFIESDLGQELKQKGLYAIGISFVIVLLFMIVYYRFAGVVAALALLLNLLFILALVMAIQQPLTLTGLAGLVLTVGMSVDANVLIFERIREELAKGAALRMAIRNGFDKATTTIVDANVTTLITAIVLYVIGTEQIKGFAVTLILGILMSMFTAIYCSRTVFDIWERKRWLTRLGMITMLDKPNFNFISKRFIAGVVSIVLIGVGIAAMFGLQDRILHHDLRGGSTVRVVFKEAPGTGSEGRDAVFEELSNAELDFEEEVEFSVSSVSARLTDEFKDRIYKIDSNLPSYDGEGESPYEELPEVIARVFDGKLELLNVEVGEPSIAGPAAVAIPQTDDSPADDQDDSDQPAGSDTESELAADQEVEATSDDDATEPQTGDDSGNDFTAGSDTKPESEEASFEVPKITTPLNFKFPVSGKAIKNFVITAAENAGYELIREQISLSAPGMTEEDSVNSFMSNEWEVEMNLSNTDDASEIFNGFAEKFNDKPYFPTISSVGGQIARATQLQALVAIIASLIGIIAYVWIRFQNVAFGLAAVVALIHDVLIVLGAIAISHYVYGSLGFLGIENFKISLPIVAALLTIIGYSLNDTIVVFDRIREVRGKRPELNAEIINTSISQTLSRTILTSLTTFIVVFILYCFGGDAIHGFAFALVIGVIAGTYSSIFVASPVLLWLMNSVGLNPGDPIVAETEKA